LSELPAVTVPGLFLSGISCASPTPAAAIAEARTLIEALSADPVPVATPENGETAGISGHAVPDPAAVPAAAETLDWVEIDAL